MFESNTEEIIIFVVICTLLLLTLIAFIAVIIYKYQKKQHSYFKDLEELKSIHKTNLLQTQIEMQEQTFQNISREIHDNIGQKLTLAKLHLNTLAQVTDLNNADKIQSAVQFIGEAIADLSDLSRSMSSDIVLQNGLLKALDFEVRQLSKLGLYRINFSVSEQTSFLEPHTELVIFRIVQEAINNILKHSSASEVDINVQYSKTVFMLEIKDNGIGFNSVDNKNGAGLLNMNKRASLLGGSCTISNSEKRGACITIKIPLNDYKQAV